MTDQHDPLIARLESWLRHDDGSVLSERVMDAVNAELPAIQQLRLGWRRSLPTSGIAKASYAVAGIAAVAVLIFVLGRWSSDTVGEPSPTPESSASGAPQSTLPPSPLPTAPSGLDVGGVGMVVATEPLVIRSAPGTGPDSIILEGSLWPGMRFGIVEGPVVTSGYDWYLIRAGELQGWSAMASREGEPWMASVVNGLIAYGGFAAATSDNVADTRELRALAPGHEPSLITSLSYDDLQPQTDLDSAAGGGVVDCPGGLAVAWSPWGDRVALAAHYGCNGVIYTLNADGTGLVRHSDGQNPVWSPDGTRIAFALNAPWFPCGPSCYEYPPGGWEVQVAEVDGGAPTSLTDSPAWTSATSPMWSPDGGTLAFLRTDLSDGSLAYPPNEVHLINADGTGQRFLTNGHAVGWAPDGRSLLVYRLVNQSTVEYWVVRVDGSGEILLPLQFTGGQRVAWSPDGSQLAVSGWNEENGSQTYLVSPDGSDITPIAVAGAFEGWSPDGRVILLSREGPEGSIELIRFTYSDSHVDVVGAGIFYGFAWQPVLVYPAS